MPRLNRIAILCGLLAIGVLTPAAPAEETVSAPQKVRKVLFIGIDGCRPDALAAAETPNLDRLAAGGVMSTNTTILAPRPTTNDTVSGPGWLTIYSGVFSDKHGVTNNTFKGQVDTYPHFFALLRQIHPDAETASFCTWTPIKEKIVTAATVNEAFDAKGESYAEHDQHMADAACEYLATADPEAVCVYFGQVDSAGHGHGFHPSVPEYLTAIETVDGGVGRVMKAVADRKTAANEDWLVVVTTDHGGFGTNHGGGREKEEVCRTFLIVSGDGVKDPGPGRQTYQVDVVPTALTWLGVPIDPKWNLDGTAFGLGK